MIQEMPTARQRAKTTIATETEPIIFDPQADSPLPDAEIRQKKDRYHQFKAAQEIDRISIWVFGVPATTFKSLSEAANAIDHLVYEVTVTVHGVALSLIYRINIGSLPETHLYAEEVLNKTWATHGVPVPKIFATCVRGSEFDYDFTVTERIGTTNLEVHLTHHPADTAEYAKLAGAFLSSIHQVALPGFGNLSLSAAGRGSLSGVCHAWDELIFSQLEETLFFLLQHHIVTPDIANQIEAALAENVTFFKTVRGVSLHGDYHPANILIDATQRQVVAAIDLSKAKIGDPVFDLAFYATYCSPEVVAAFRQGYETVSPLPEATERRLALYQLRILASKAKLRYRFGYEAKIPQAVTGIEQALKFLQA